jgi:Nucleotide modification associated domain 1
MIKYGNPMFFQILEELSEMHQKKGRDYGTTNDPLANVRASTTWGVPSWVGTMIRANDKVIRLQNAAKGSTLINEGIEDSLLDLASYAIIALALYREEQETSKV